MKRILLILLLTVLAITSYSNGGALDMSHFRKTGHIRLLQKANILLLKEDLKIKVIGDYTQIEVNYELQNKGSRQNIQYGFPVDAYETDWWFGDPLEVFTGSNDCLKYFFAFDNDKPLKVSQWIVDSIYSVQPYAIENSTKNPNAKKYQIVRKWSAITLLFETNETKKLTIKYKIKNTLRDKFVPFKDIPRYSERHFTYDLRPSKYWGNGIVNEMNIEVDMNEIGQQGFKYTIAGVDNFKSEKHKYILNDQNYNLKQSDRIEIQYSTIPLKMAELIELKKLNRSSIIDISSSTNEDDINNMVDDNHKTIWNGKKDDWIEFVFDGEKANSLLGILMLNGNYSSKEQFLNTGTIGKFSVLVNDTKWYNTQPWGEEVHKIINVPKSEYMELETRLMPGLSIILTDGIHPKECKKLRIEIIEGKGAISEIYFLKRKKSSR